MIRSIREWFSIETKKWTVFVLAMVIVVIAFTVIGVTLLDSQSTGDKLVQQLQTERAAHRHDNAKFEATINKLETDFAELASNQSLVLRRQFAEDIKQARILKFVRNHPGAPIPEILLQPVPLPTLQTITTSTTKKATPPKAKARGHK